MRFGSDMTEGLLAKLFDNAYSQGTTASKDELYATLPHAQLPFPTRAQGSASPANIVSSWADMVQEVAHGDFKMLNDANKQQTNP